MNPVMIRICAILAPCVCAFVVEIMKRKWKGAQQEAMLAQEERESNLDQLLNAFASVDNANYANLLGSPDDGQELSGEFEENSFSGVMTTINDGTEAKEEGNTYFKAQRYEEAVRCYSESIYESPTAVAYANRAMSYIKLNKFIEAEKDCTDAIRMDDNYFKAYARRGMARAKIGNDLKGALEDVQVALMLEPNSQEMIALQAQLKCLNEGTQAKEEGNAFFKDRKFEDAIKCYSRSIVLSPTTTAYSNRAMAYLKLHKFVEAEKDCTEALKIDSHHFKAYARRAIARTKLGRDLKGALEDVKAALDLEPNSQEMKDLRTELKRITSRWQN